jgi:hypothetical protein
MHWLDAATLVVPSVLPDFDSEPGGAAWPELEERGLVRLVTGEVAWLPGEEKQVYELTDLGAADGPALNPATQLPAPEIARPHPCKSGPTGPPGRRTGRCV